MPTSPDLYDGVVRLRALRAADIGSDRGDAPGERSVVAQCRDTDSVRWTTVPLDYTATDGAAFLARAAAGWESGSSFVLAVADATDDAFLGSVDLRPDGPGSFQVGFALGPWARGRGVMPRALVLLLDWAFAAAPGGLGAQVVQWRAHVGNWASRRAAWKAGFRGFAEVRGGLTSRGGLVDGWVATVRADEVGRPDGIWPDVPILPVTARDGSAWALRAFRGPDDDAEVAGVVAACSDALTQRWLHSLPRPYTADHARTFLATRPAVPATGEGITWALADVAGGPAVASLSVFGLGRSYGTPELGWWAVPSVRGRGLVAAGVRVVADWVLHRAPEGVRTHRLNAEVDAGNGGSARVALAAGFTEFGRGHAEDPDPAGGWSDCRYFELLREDARRG